MSVWEEIVDYTVTSNTTQVDFTGLNITKDDFIKIVPTFITNSTKIINIYPNSQSTSTNYHRQELRAYGSSIDSNRRNDGRTYVPISSGDGNGPAFTYLKLSENDRFNTFTNDIRATNSGLETVFNYVTSSNYTFSSGISSLLFSCETSSGILAGTRIQIYRLTAEKVADITVASNTTQVDITGLNIDKGSEYLLVSDVKTTFSPSRVFITPNDLNTLSGYYSQLIYANGSISSATRENNPSLIDTDDNISYTHIKLSNIDAFTAQTYSIKKYGSSSVEARNWFCSSIDENITSINKLNLIANELDRIGAGSRFQLYKLY